jgi:NAD(P)-dependent dehydrogenase (short-subunit alcohol dehydrogenase family)
MGEESNNHAIVFGASGLIGWALVDQLLSPYPHAGSFSKVTAATNRPLNLSESHWPEPDSHRPDLQLVSGVDLRHGDAAALAECLKREVKDIESVTHIYYLGMALFPLQRSLTETHRHKSSPQLKTTSKRSRPTCACFEMSSTRTTCSVPICGL